jgi:hypothetical protein
MMHGAARKVAVNTLVGRDLFRLAHDEYVQLLRAASVSCIWLPPSALKACTTPSGWKGPRPPAALRLAIGRALGRDVGGHYKFNLVSYRPLKREPLALRRTFGFLHEIVTEGRACEDTTLFREAMGGLQIVRRVNGEKVLLSDPVKFKLYYDQCVTLAASIRQDNIRPPATEESYISVAIDRNGEFLHLSKGLHRLGIAMELGIGSVPVTVRIISAHYFRNFFSLYRSFSVWHVVNAIKASVEHALAHANTDSATAPAAVRPITTNAMDRFDRPLPAGPASPPGSVGLC